MFVLAKKNVENKRSGIYIYNLRYDISFVIIQSNNFYKYTNVSYNNAIYIFNYQFLNLIGQIIYYLRI